MNLLPTILLDNITAIIFRKLSIYFVRAAANVYSRHRNNKIQIVGTNT